MMPLLVELVVAMSALCMDVVGAWGVLKLLVMMMMMMMMMKQRVVHVYLTLEVLKGIHHLLWNLHS